MPKIFWEKWAQFCLNRITGLRTVRNLTFLWPLNTNIVKIYSSFYWIFLKFWLPPHFWGQAFWKCNLFWATISTFHAISNLRNLTPVQKNQWSHENFENFFFSMKKMKSDIFLSINIFLGEFMASLLNFSLKSQKMKNLKILQFWPNNFFLSYWKLILVFPCYGETISTAIPLNK